jgi:hypothetical protein
MTGLDSSEFNELTYNVYEAYQKDKKADLLHMFPKLRKIPSFAAYEEADRNYIIRYIILLYDKGTPLIRRYEKLDKRKVEAALIAGFETKKDGSFKDDKIKLILENKEDKVLEMITQYVASLGDRRYALIVANEHVFYKNLESLFKTASYPDDHKKELDALVTQDKILEMNEKIDARLQANYRAMFGEDEDLIEKVTRKGLMTPEKIAGGK